MGEQLRQSSVYKVQAVKLKRWGREVVGKVQKEWKGLKGYQELWAGRS